MTKNEFLEYTRIPYDFIRALWKAWKLIACMLFIRIFFPDRNKK